MTRSGPGGSGTERDGRTGAGRDADVVRRMGVQDFQRNDLSQMLDGAIHDLRTPLGAMSGWLEVIETELGEVDGVLGKAVAGLRRAVDEQSRMIHNFSNAFEVLREPFDVQRRCGFVDRLLAAAERLDPESRARIGLLEHLQGQSRVECTDGGIVLDDGLLMFLRLLALAAIDETSIVFTIDGEDEGLVVHLRSKPACVDALLAFCNGLNRAAVRRVNFSLPTLWAARLALIDSGLEPGARVARRGLADAASVPRSDSADGSAAGSDIASVDMVIWLRIVGADPTAAADSVEGNDRLDADPLLFGNGQRRAGSAPRDALEGRIPPSPRLLTDGLAAVGALAAGEVDAAAPRIGPHPLSLDAILAPVIDTMPFEAVPFEGMPFDAMPFEAAGLGNGSRSVDAALSPPLGAGAGGDDEATDTGNRTILIVDDQKDIREMLALWLRCHQFQVVVAGSAREARQRLAESGEIQAALIDIRMPEEDGISLLRSIRDRENERGERRMPALAITAQPSFETQTSALQAGFSGMLSKPLRLRQLIELVENLH